ncbi:siderophore-interacting protein [Chitiniphilus eburneus]|uniref:siderophore-interacting protein n=1 Tax=Chitiniphilus eburneus TaxID=2571148 RepID=UPI0035D0846E
MSDTAPPRWTPPRRLQVRHTRAIGRHLCRVTFGGPDLAGFPEGSGGLHIKLFFPHDGEATPLMPELGPDGPVWPEGRRPITRTYTVRQYDPATQQLDVDFVLHGDNGPASRWASRAQPGDVLGLAGPGATVPYTPGAQWFLFAGDLSSLPAISAVLERLPPDARGVALIEVPDDADRHALRHPEGIALRWLVRQGPAEGSTLLLDAIRALSWPAPDTALSATVAGESGAVVAIRAHLLRERGIARRALYAVPYWRAGQDEETYHQERHRIMDEEESA